MGLSDLPLFAALDAGEPMEWKADLGDRSYGAFHVLRDGDGLWRFSTEDHFQGYCGHGGGSYRASERREDAILAAAESLERRWIALTEDRSSCCSDKHRNAARKGLAALYRDFPDLQSQRSAA